MKKILLSLAVISAAASASAQTDTLTSHFVGNPTLYIPDAVQPADSGYISGNNAYGDLAKMQLFDATYGVVGGGTISKVLLGLPVKMDGGGSFQIAIWGDNAGQPATPLAPLGFVNATLASVDTSVAAFSIVDGTRFYNFIATFATPVAIPANHKFWAGIVLPTGATDALALFTSDLTANPFADATTHTGEFWNDMTFHTFGDPQNWNADVALAIYPIVTIVASVEDFTVTSSVYPNPASTELNIQINEEVSLVTVTTLDGKIVSSSTSKTIDVSNLNQGLYIYQVTTANGNVSTGTFVKK